MRRSPIVLGATIAGTAAVLAFHTSTPAVLVTASATTRSTTTSRSPTTSSGLAGSSSGSTSASPATSTSSTAAPGTATGNAINTRYGDVQVRVTVANGRITDIQAVQLTNADPRSVEISASAEPSLKQEALSKQSANVDAISGATYTSAAYAQSLQSALDKLGFKAANGPTTLQVPS